MHRRYRKFVLQLYRRLRHPRILKQSRMMRWFATHFLAKDVWRPTRHSLAGGIGIGTFISAFLLPGQMPAAAFLCGVLRVNIPIAIVLCWLSNPLTFAPIAWWEISLGNWLIQWLEWGEVVPLRWSQLTKMAREAETLWSFFDDIRPWGKSLYLGAFVGGALAGIVGYILTYLLWDVMRWLFHPKAKKADPKA